MNRPRGIAPSRPLVACGEVGALSCLVAQRPPDDRRVVLVALDHPGDPIQVGGQPGRIVGEAVLRAEAVRVAFDVGLVHHVQAVLVAQGVPLGIVGVVRRPDGVDVVPFHQLDVAHHQGAIDGVPRERAVLVAVHALHQDGLAVDEESAAADLDRPEADARGDNFERAPGSVLQRQERGIEVRCFRRPAVGGSHRERQRHRPLAPGRHRGGRGNAAPHLAAVCIEQLQRHRRRRCPSTAIRHRDRRLQSRVDPRVIEDGPDLEVPHVRVGGAPQVHVPEDAAQPEHVLILEERTIAPAVHFDGQHVGTLPEVARDVELGRRAAVLAVTHPRAVHPDVEGRVHAREVQQHAPARPLRRDVERCPVRADGVVVARRPRVLRLVREGIPRVAVDGHAETLNLPVARHNDVLPPRVIEPGELGAGGPRGRAWRIVEPPWAVQRSEPG